MDTLQHVPVQRNLIECILDLPAELRNPIFLYIWPATLRVHYYLPMRISKDPLLYEIPPVRLTSVDHCSVSSPDYVFRFSDQMITRAWYQAMVEHLDNTTQWDLGGVTQLHEYIQTPRNVKHRGRPMAYEGFLGRLESVRHTCINFREEYRGYMGYRHYGRHVKKLLEIPDVTNDFLMVSTLRVHLDRLFELDADEQSLLADVIAVSVGILNHASKGFQKVPHIKIRCSKAAFNSRSGQRFSDRIRQRCGSDAVKWAPTGTCRYEGQLGDLTIAWKAGDSQQHSQCPAGVPIDGPNAWNDPISRERLERLLYAPWALC